MHCVILNEISFKSPAIVYDVRAIEESLRCLLSVREQSGCSVLYSVGRVTQTGPLRELVRRG